MVKAVLLGVVEGLTEFLPVSSTGHLVLFGEAIQYNGPAAQTFEIFIQLGAILAVVFLYPKRFLCLLNFKEKVSSASFTGRSGLIKLFLACIPAFVLGALFHSTIKASLLAPFPVAMALIFGGIVLIVIERVLPKVHASRLETITFRQAFLIGIFQCAALWPGISRSGATIVGGLILGLSRQVAAEFSFLVAVPVMAAATCFDLLKSWESLGSDALGELAVGFLVSFVVALFAIRTFVGFLQRFSLAGFGYYRVILGIISLVWFLGIVAGGS